MTSSDYSRFHRTVQRLATTRPVSWCLARVHRSIDGMVLRASGNRYSATSLLAGVPLVILTTTGAKSGRPRTTPLLCIRAPRRPNEFAVVGTNHGQAHNPGWVYNLRKTPAATATIDGQTAHYVAHEATVDDEYRFWWDRAVAVFPGYENYRSRIGSRHVPIMVLKSVECV